MVTCVPDQPARERPETQEGRERLAQLLGFAFPLGGNGTFTGLMDAINHEPERTTRSGAERAVK
jgi:hypothetical protein